MVVETRLWSRRRETVTIGTPASGLSVAMKCRTSCNRNTEGRPEPDRLAVPPEGLGDPVRLPGRGPIVITEHEPLPSGVPTVAA